MAGPRPRGAAAEPKQRGEWGLAGRWSPAWLDGSLGLYYRSYADKMPQTLVTQGPAGPGGADVCGSNCDGFCTIAADACPGTFADDAACQAACAGYDKVEAYDAADMAGDSFACRLYHLTVASTPLAMHCPHILPDSVPCGG